MAEMQSLETTIAPLRRWFEERERASRFIAVMSPTCGLCLQGARSVQETVLGPDAPAELEAAIVLIDIMESDDERAAAAAAVPLEDPRATFFHDPKHLAGLAIARTLGWKHHAAWDIHLFFAPGVRWQRDAPPPPTAWYQQLRDREVWEEQAEEAVGSSEWTKHLADVSEADPEHFRTGSDLRAALAEAAHHVAAMGTPQAAGARRTI